MNREIAEKFAAWIAGDVIRSTDLDKDAVVDGKEIFTPDFDITAYLTRVGIVVMDAKTGKIILRRPEGLFGGSHWTFAKGGIEAGEDPLEAAFREVEEELDISKEVLSLKGALKRMYLGRGTRNYYFIATVHADAVFKDGVASVVYPPCYETEKFVFADLLEAKILNKETTSRRSRFRDFTIVDDLVLWAKSMDPDLED